MSTLTMNAPLIAMPKRKEEPAMPDFVEQKLFASEMKRVDSEISNIKKAEERQNKTVSEDINGLRGDINGLRKDMKDLEKELRGEMNSNFRWLVGMYVTGTGAILAAFYAFASYIKG